MAATYTKNLRDGVITILDGTATPNSVEVTLDEGDLSWTETHNVIEVDDRGTLDHVREGSEEAMDVSFSLKYVEAYGTVTAPYEALKQVNNASGWTSTRPEDVYCVSARFEVLDTSDATTETIMFPDFYYTDITFAEGDDYDTLSVTGRSFATEPSIS